MYCDWIMPGEAAISGLLCTNEVYITYAAKEDVILVVVNDTKMKAFMSYR